MDKSDNKIDILEGKIDKLDNRMDNLEGRMDSLENEVQGLKFRWKELILQSNKKLNLKSMPYLMVINKILTK